MGVKVKYTVMFLVGILVVSGIAYFGYWLLAIYKVENTIGQIVISLFIIIPSVKVILSLPIELRILALVWTSDIPEDIEKAVAIMRERDLL